MKLDRIYILSLILIYIPVSLVTIAFFDRGKWVAAVVLIGVIAAITAILTPGRVERYHQWLDRRKQTRYNDEEIQQETTMYDALGPQQLAESIKPRVSEAHTALQQWNEAHPNIAHADINEAQECLRRAAQLLGYLETGHNPEREAALAKLRASMGHEGQAGSDQD